MPDPAPADPVAAKVDYLSACIDTAIVSPESFDLPGLLADLGRALAAVETAMEHHQPVGLSRRGIKLCGLCRESWPCSEVRAISAALLSEEGSGHG